MIALAATLAGGWMFLNLLGSFAGDVGLLIIAAAVAGLITALRVVYQRMGALERRIELLEAAQSQDKAAEEAAANAETQD